MILDDFHLSPRLTHEAAQGQGSSADALNEVQADHREQEVDSWGDGRQPDGSLIAFHAWHADDGGTVVPVTKTHGNINW